MEKIYKIENEISKEHISRNLDKYTEIEKIQNQLWETELAKQQSTLSSMEDNREARKIYAARIFIFVAIYTFIVLGFFYLYQFELVPYSCAQISDKPIIALLTSTTANVIALLIIVMKYLFPNTKK